MFQNNTTNKSSNDFNSYLAPLTPIHLMKNDLEEIKNPKKDVSKQISEPATLPANFSEKQKSSPFFNDNDPQKNQKNDSEKTSQSSTKNLPQKLKSEKSTNNFALNKLLVIFAIFFLFLVIGAVGYYFWTTSESQSKDNQTVNTVDEPNDQSAIAEPESKKQTEKSIDISTEKPNYLSIDIAITEKEYLNSRMDLYLKKAEELKLSSLAEFILTDTSNNPIGFKVFAEKIGIALPAQITSLLKDAFSLYIYNDNGNYRLGISVDSLDDKKLKTEMLKEENELLSDLAPILKNPENRPLTEEKYLINTYKNTSIRYSNIVSLDYLSIDYAILNKKLVIGTTQNTMYALIDYLSLSDKNTAKEIESSADTENKTSKPTDITDEITSTETN